MPLTTGVIAKQSANLEITEPADLNALTIGVIRDDIGHELLLSSGVDEENIHLNSNTNSMLKMLIADRVDAVAYGENVARWHLKKMAVDPEDFDVIHKLKEGKTGYAFHKDTAPAIIEQLQTALDELKADGTVDRITDKYLQSAK